MARMAPKTKRVFEFFVEDANKTGLHPTDWRRFYTFVQTARRYRSQIWEQDVKKALMGAGFDEDYARHLSDIYCHCWRMLSAFSSPVAAAEWRRRTDEEIGWKTRKT